MRAGDSGFCWSEGHYDGDTLCDPDFPIVYERMVSDPVLWRSIEPKSTADEEN